MLDGASEFVLRTNPKLTTNVKLITNGDKIWLESYNATKSLSDSRYKSVKVSPHSSYGKDVVKFYDKLDKSAAYKVMEEYDSESVKDNYTAQYESFYWAGCERIDSLEYNEDIGMCAPLWISDKLPDMFIIFKLKEPTYHVSTTQDTKIPDLDFRTDILDKCTIIRTFDLTENSPIGTYLRNYAAKSGFPKAPVTLSLDPDTVISYNGISYENGEFTSAQEHCHPLMYEHDDTILYLERYITEGFERNGIICANLINLEFLFDDDTAEDYTLNRYFGLYCNAIQDASFKVDCNQLVHAGNTYMGNPTMFSLYNQRNLTATNPNGVIIPTIYSGGINGMPTANDITDLDSVFCIRDINGDMHNLSRENPSALPQDHIRLTNTTFPLAKLKGLVPVEKTAPCEYTTEPASAQVFMTINGDIPAYTELVLWNKVGGTLVRIGAITSSYTTDANGNIIHQPGWYENDMFYGSGSTEMTADAICNSFNKTFDVGLTAYRTGSNVIISATNHSSTYENMSITVDNCADASCITMQNGGNFFGACPYGHLVIDESSLGLFSKGTYVRSKSKNGYAMITGITQNIDTSTKYGNILNYENETKYNVITDEDIYGVTRNNTVETFAEYIPEMCRLSFFPVTDFNYSTYGKSIWGEMGELGYEKDLIENIISQAEEFASGSNLNTLDELNQTVDGSNLEIEFETNGLIVNGAAGTYEVQVFDGDSNPDEFDIVIDFMAINPLAFQDTYNKITKTGFNFSTLSTSLNKNVETYIDNEYTRCYENYAASLMLLSKTQPWICKWVYKGGTDVRDNPYRLNTSPAFGQLSFSPDHRSFSPDPNLYNQEWGYIFDVIPHDMILDINNQPVNDWTKIWSYIGEAAVKDVGGTIYDNNVERNLKSTTEDWFDTYFKRDYYNTTGNQTDTLDHIRKYSIFDNGTNSVSSTTFFMGAEIELIEKSDWSEQVNNNLDNIKKQFSGNMNGYRFTAVLVPITVTDATAIGDIKTKVIRNDMFKFVVLIIYIVKQYDDAIDVLKGIDPSNCKTIPLQTINRYVMYNPSTNIINTSQTDPITMKGAGMITDITYEPENHRYEIRGSNTNFTNDFIPYTDNNAINGNTYEKQILFVQNYNHASPIKVYYVFTITDVVSDTLMYARLADPNSTEVYDTYNVLRNAIPNWIQGNLNNIPQVGDNHDAYFICNCNYGQFANELNRSVFGSIYHDINVMQSENVVYELIDKNGDFHTSSNPNGNNEYPFALMFVKPNDNAKYKYLTMQFDGQYITYGTQPDYAFPMLRHDGLFTPHRTEILKYKDPYIEKITGNLTPREKRLLESSRHLNTCFASDYQTFAKIFNLAFHRANDRNSNVYRLKDGDKPLYPVDNKFPIGTRTYNIFNSPWDPKHYTTTLSETNETDSHGTLSMKEHKSFLSTTTLKTPETITLETFITSDTPSDDITCLYEIKNSNIAFDVYVEKRLIEYFTDKLTTLFNHYIDAQYSYGDKTTVSDDIESYIRENLLSLYQLSEITFYTKEVTNPTQSFIFTYMNQSDSLKERNGLIPNQTIGISTISESNFDRHIVFNTKQKRIYSFGISVKITRR